MGSPSSKMHSSHLNVACNMLTKAVTIRSLSERSSESLSATEHLSSIFTAAIGICSMRTKLLLALRSSRALRETLFSSRKARQARKGIVFLFIILLASTVFSQTRWYKGNTHTHTTNSDGDSAPVDVVRWY